MPETRGIGGDITSREAIEFEQTDRLPFAVHPGIVEAVKIISSCNLFRYVGSGYCWRTGLWTTDGTRRGLCSCVTWHDGLACILNGIIQSAYRCNSGRNIDRQCWGGGIGIKLMSTIGAIIIDLHLKCLFCQGYSSDSIDDQVISIGGSNLEALRAQKAGGRCFILWQWAILCSKRSRIEIMMIEQGSWIADLFQICGKIIRIA